MAAKREPESVGRLAGYALGISAAFAASSLRAVERLYPTTAAKPYQHWIGYVLAAGVASLVLVPRVRRSPYYTLAVCGLAPTVIAMTYSLHFGFRTAAGHKVRAIGFVVAFVAEFAVAVGFFRQKRELDRHVFTQSGLIAFLATVVFGVVYGAAEDAFGAPHLALTWLALFALVVFVAGLTFLERRYS